MTRMRLGDILIEENIINAEQLQYALATQKTVKKRLGEIIIDLGFANERDILRSLSKRLSVEYVETPSFLLDVDVVHYVPENLAQKYIVVPIRIDNGKLVIATNDPLNLEAVQDISMISGLDVEMVLSPLDEIRKTMGVVYSRKAADEIIRDLNVEFKFEDEPTPAKVEVDNMAERVDSAPIVRLVNTLIVDAYQRNASDIHIEPEETTTRIRFRIDGDLTIYNEVTNEVHASIVTRIKILSGLDIAEKRIPQDGSFKVKNKALDVDLRVSTMPTPYGEKVVMRLLGANKNITYNLNALGVSPASLERINKALMLPNGILLVSGPTGSGKTTTLYAILDSMADPAKSITTIEDPIELQFEGITQVQVNPKTGLTFATGLRSVLRQDPDIIMVGEIRDKETAEIAIRAAITGHFVLSTIHTNDSVSTVSRLVDMGIEPFMVASALRCVISQRLVKRICPECRGTVKVTPAENMLLKTNLTTAYKGKGCKKCNNTGYQGRTAVYEILLIDNKLQSMIAANASAESMYTYIHDNNLRILKDEVIEAIKNGLTTTEEAVKILYTVD